MRPAVAIHDFEQHARPAREILSLGLDHAILPITAHNQRVARLDFDCRYDHAVAPAGASTISALSDFRASIAAAIASLVKA